MTKPGKTCTRRSFLKAAGTGALAAATSGVAPAVVRGASTDPIIIGHQAELTGGLSSWGYWLDKAARAAVNRVNREGGITGRQVKYLVEDTETNPATGTRKMRRLVQRENSDFIIGSVHSGVLFASIPVAQELKILYWPLAMASEATAEKGNRYVFRANSHVREQVQASVRWAFENLGKKWTIAISDYAWGWSHRDWFKKEMEALGGKVLAELAIPQGTKDFVPFVSKIPGDTEGIYYLFFGADTLGFLQQLHELGYKGKKFSAICTLEAIDLEKLGDAVEGAWALEYLPRQIKYKDTGFNREFRKQLGADDDGREIGNPLRVIAGSHYWSTWESIYLLKKGIEVSGWKSRKDTKGLIEALEGMRVKESLDFPQGDLLLRAEDHQGFHQHWMSRIEKGKLEVKFTVPTEQVIYAPPVDFRKEKL
jgi:branched-chain amino acid transport system substrate-binding protein